LEILAVSIRSPVLKVAQCYCSSMDFLGQYNEATWRNKTCFGLQYKICSS
jgi:hypothetical protein